MALIEAAEVSKHFRTRRGFIGDAGVVKWPAYSRAGSRGVPSNGSCR